MIAAPGELSICPPALKPTAEEAQEAFIALGARNVNVAALEKAAKSFAWLQQTGAKAIAVAEIMEDLAKWKRIEEKYDPLLLGEFSEEKMDSETLMEYMKFRLQISLNKVTSYKEIVRLADPATQGPNKKGVKASIAPVTTINPLSGRV